MIFTASQFDGEMTLCGKKRVMVEYWKDNGQRRGNKIKKNILVSMATAPRPLAPKTTKK